MFNLTVALKQYPHHVQTGLRLPRPETIGAGYGDFFRFPYNKLDCAVWGFLTEEAARRFAHDFSGSVLNGAVADAS